MAPRRRQDAWLIPWLLCLGLVPVAPLQAQLHRATDSVVSPPASVVYRDDALTLDINPAGLGLLPSWSLAYVHANVGQEQGWLAQGDALYMASPLLFGLSAGLTLQSIRPDAASQNRHHGMAAFALALSPTPRFSVGTTLRALTSADSDIDGLTSWDVGMAWRPTPVMDIDVVARDLFATRGGQGIPDALRLDPSVIGSLRLRALDSLVLHAGLALDTAARVGGRAGIGWQVPHVGVLGVLGEVEEMFDANAVYRVMAGLNAQWGPATLGGGVLGGQGFGGGAGWFAFARLEGVDRPGLPGPRYVLEVPLEGSIGTRRLIRVAQTLEMAAHDARVAGLVLRLRETGIGLAHAQELRLLVTRLRDAGKPVLCHLEAASGAEYYACAAATQVLMDPAGSARLMGLSSQAILLGDALAALGVRADFLRIGEFKSAPEQYTMRRMGGPARSQTNALLDDLYARLVADLGDDLQRSPGEVAEVIDQGPYLASEAMRSGLIHGAADGLQLAPHARELFGSLPVLKRMPQVSGGWGIPPRIGVVIIDGTIVDGESVDVPLVGIHMSGGRTIAETLDALAADPTVRAIVLRIDSPGGAVLASDQIWRAVRRARARKPVIASMGSVAASGGYYAASAADEIWADPATVTGSIGIFAGKVDLLPLAQRLGVGVEQFQRGAHAGAQSWLRAYAPEERAALADKIRTYYRLFLARVAEGRGMQPAQVHRVARGRVWSGDAARKHGLVDRLGGFADALAEARRRADVGPDAEVVVRPERRDGLIDYVLGGGGRADVAMQEEDDPRSLVRLPRELNNIAPLLLNIAHAGGDMPLAMLPYVLDPP